MRQLIAVCFATIGWGLIIGACLDKQPLTPQNEAESNYEAAINMCVDEAGSVDASHICRAAVNRAFGIVVKEKSK